MISKIRLLPLTLLAVLALVLAACGGGGDEGNSGDSSDGSSPPQRQTDDGYGSDDSDEEEVAADPGTDEELFVSNGIEVLKESADAFAGQEVTSMSGDVAFDFSMGGTAMAGAANFKFAGDQMHMTMEFEGGDSQSLVDLSQFGQLEMLVRDGAFYMNIPFLGGWFVMTPEDLGTSAEQVQEMLSEGSPFDYGLFLANLTEQVTYVGDEDVNGEATAHYQFAGDLQTLIGSFSNALAAAGDNAFADQITGSELNGPTTVDIWVGKSDLLPYKLDVTSSIESPAGPVTMTLSANFTGYNESVEIPDAPADAISFSELMAQFGGMPATQ